MFISATVLGTLLLAVFAVIFGLRAIENKLETDAAGLVDYVVAAAAEEDPSISLRTDVAVQARATDLNLRGTVGLEEHTATLQEMVARLDGVGTVTAELEYLAPVHADSPDVTAAPITVSWAGGSATIFGEVSDEANRVALVSTLEDAFSGDIDSTGFVVKEGAPSERDWLSPIIGLLKIGGETLPEGKIFVNASERLVQMSGEYETRQGRADAMDDIEALVAGTTFAFTSGLSIPEPPAYTPQDVVDLQESIDDLIEGKVVEFELNSNVLTPVGVELLDEVLAALHQFPNVPIEIAGHTDSQGDAAENLDLSERRAQAALDYFIANGQDAERFVVRGYGEDFPVASNDTEDGRARNRRIEFKALEE